MSNISIKNDVDISTRVVSAPEVERVDLTPIWFLNTGYITRGKVLFFTREDKSYNDFLDSNIANFVRQYFSYRDKSGKYPKRVAIATSFVGAMEAGIKTRPINFPEDVPNNGQISFRFLSGAQAETVVAAVTNVKSTPMSSLAASIQSQLRQELSKIATFKNLTVSYNSVTKGLEISAGTTGEGRIEIIPTDFSKYLNLDDTALIVDGASSTTFTKNIINTVKTVSDRVHAVAFDNIIVWGDLISLSDLNQQLDFPKILLATFARSRYKDIISTLKTLDLPDIALCFTSDDPPYGEGVINYNDLKTALIITQQISATTFEQNSTIADFNLIPVSSNPQVTTQELLVELESMRFSYIAQINFNVLRGNLFKGGMLTGDGSKYLIYIKHRIADMWLKSMATIRLFRLMTKEQSLDRSSESVGKVRSVLENLATDCKENGIFASSSGMSKELMQTIDQEVLDGILEQDYYLKVWADSIKENNISKNVIVYELHYYAGNIIKKIIGVHTIYN